MSIVVSDTSLEQVKPLIDLLQNELDFFVAEKLRDEVLAECQE